MLNTFAIVEHRSLPVSNYIVHSPSWVKLQQNSQQPQYTTKISLLLIILRLTINVIALFNFTIVIFYSVDEDRKFGNKFLYQNKKQQANPWSSFECSNDSKYSTSTDNGKHMHNSTYSKFAPPSSTSSMLNIMETFCIAFFNL